MTPNLLTWCRRLCALACFAAPAARADGNYYAAGQIIKARANAERLRVELL